MRFVCDEYGIVDVQGFAVSILCLKMGYTSKRTIWSDDWIFWVSDFQTNPWIQLYDCMHIYVYTEKRKNTLIKYWSRVKTHFSDVHIISKNICSFNISLYIYIYMYIHIHTYTQCIYNIHTLPRVSEKPNRNYRWNPVMAGRPIWQIPGRISRWLIPNRAMVDVNWTGGRSLWSPKHWVV